ncbi:FAD-dependent oxidoreductase [Teredinibacter turnerae]|uniref:FAD-dependent oxidoreductase n=1 Tax=Teredinibacter turnerae TaxID=2426 RepID=UPI003BAE7BC0
MNKPIAYDMLVIGSGPAGQKAAVEAARSGASVALIEKTRKLGGACVQRGTIPSKTLRENALRVRNMRMNAQLSNFKLAEDTELATLITRLNNVLNAHDEYMRKQLERTKVNLIHGRAKFLSPQDVEVESVRGEKQTYRSGHILIATGSHPRKPPDIPVDHEHLFDSDSILSMMYLPKKPDCARRWSYRQ